MNDAPKPRPDLKAVTANMRKIAEALQCAGQSAQSALRGQDKFTVAAHPDLDALNHELNNLYGNSFE